MTLMTLHASKGLEFPAVYVIGIESGLIPHERAVREGDPASFEEERRLLFVGITRAMQELTLTQTTERTFRGMRRTTISSPFIPELHGAISRESSIATPPPITEALLDPHLEKARRRFAAAQAVGDRKLIMTAAELASKNGQLATVNTSPTDDAGFTPSFREGMQVRHPRYGRGIVTEISGGSHRATVTVVFENERETHTFVASRCPLQPVGLGRESLKCGESSQRPFDYPMDCGSLLPLSSASLLAQLCHTLLHNQEPVPKSRSRLRP